MIPVTETAMRGRMFIPPKIPIVFEILTNEIAGPKRV
jgi:hypothetical protein